MVKGEEKTHQQSFFPVTQSVTWMTQCINVTEGYWIMQAFACQF